MNTEGVYDITGIRLIFDYGAIQDRNKFQIRIDKYYGPNAMWGVVNRSEMGGYPCIDISVPRDIFLATAMANIEDCVKRAGRADEPVPCGQMMLRRY